MSSAPYFSVKIKETGRDISGLLDFMEYEGTVEKDSILTIKSSKEYSKAVAEDPELIKGARLTVQWGTGQKGVSAIKELEIVDITTKYSSSVTVTIRAFDYGNALRKNKPERKFENMTASAIVTQIAKEHKLKTKIEPTKKVYEEINQNKRSDWEIIAELANKEAFGLYMFYVDNDTLYFIKRDLKKTPFRRFVYGTNDIIGLDVMDKQLAVSSAKNKVETVSVDPMTKQVVTKTSTNGTQTKLGKVINKRDEDGKLIGTYRQSVPVPTMPKDEQQALTDTVSNDAQLSTMEAALQIDSDPLMIENEIVEIVGTAKKHEGNWYVTAAKHTVSGGSTYTVKVTLKRNASSAPLTKKTEKAADSNTKAGKKTDRVKKVVRRDVNGKIIE